MTSPRTNDTSIERRDPPPTFAVAITHAAFDADRRRHLRRMEQAFGLDGNHRHDAVTTYAVVRDHDRSGVWPTARKALQVHARGATHLLILSDDMLPFTELGPGSADGGPAMFWRELQAAVAARPNVPLSLMTMGDAPKRAASRGTTWVKSTDGFWAGSLVWPLPVLNDLWRFISTWLDPLLAAAPADVQAQIHDDHRFAVYARVVGLIPRTPAPLLVGHIAELPSLLGHPESIGGRKREAAHVYGIPPMPGPGEVDWSANPAELDAPAYLGGPTRRLLAVVDRTLGIRPYVDKAGVEHIALALRTGLDLPAPINPGVNA